MESRRHLGGGAPVPISNRNNFGDQSPAISAIDPNNSETMRDQPSLTDVQSFQHQDNYNMPVFGASKIQGSHRITIDRDNNQPNSGRSRQVQSVQMTSTMKMG